MIFSYVFFIVLAFGATLLSFNKGKDTCIAGVRNGLKSLASSIIIIVIAILIADMLSLVMPQQIITTLLGADSGLKGVFLGSISGFILAMGPHAVFPLIAVIYELGSGPGATVALITSWALFSMEQIPFAFSFLGPKVVIKYLLVIMPFPFLAGFIAYIIFG